MQTVLIGDEFTYSLRRHSGWRRSDDGQRIVGTVHFGQILVLPLLDVWRRVLIELVEQPKDGAGAGTVVGRKTIEVSGESGVHSVSFVYKPKTRKPASRKATARPTKRTAASAARKEKRTKSAGKPRAAKTEELSDQERTERIALAAYFLAEKRSFAPNHELDDWLAAERSL